MFNQIIPLINRIIFVLTLVFVVSNVAMAQDETTTTPMLVLPDGSKVGLRDAPASMAEEINNIRGAVPLIGISANSLYYLVDYRGQLGWVFSRWGRVQGNLSAVPTLDIDHVDDIPFLTTTTSLALYLIPDAESDTVAEVENGTLPLLAVTEDEQFYLLVYEGQLVWLSADQLTDDTEVEGDISRIPVIVPPDEMEPEPCTVQAYQPGTVAVRLGPGTQRLALTYLAANKTFQVMGQQADEDGNIWYALDKAEAAPRKFILGEIVWVVAAEVEIRGACDDVSNIDP
ncbi:hypothetical protein [Candidatus Leptofilum sp.]|uniref:hypothetical protein n=1 Tax=Candidatus Leptofilum sp. TaxID=3241576 RepID=UPI003B5A2E9E